MFFSGACKLSAVEAVCGVLAVNICDKLRLFRLIYLQISDGVHILKPFWSDFKGEMDPPVSSIRIHMQFVLVDVIQKSCHKDVS